jgi:hypothetical protein
MSDQRQDEAALRELAIRLLSPRHPGAASLQVTDLLPGRLPPRPPIELPLPPDARLLGSEMRGHASTTVFDTQLAPEQLLTFYRERMAAMGWTELEPGVRAATERVRSCHDAAAGVRTLLGNRTRLVAASERNGGSAGHDRGATLAVDQFRSPRRQSAAPPSGACDEPDPATAGARRRPATCAWRRRRRRRRRLARQRRGDDRSRPRGGHRALHGAARGCQLASKRTGRGRPGTLERLGVHREGRCAVARVSASLSTSRRSDALFPRHALPAGRVWVVRRRRRVQPLILGRGDGRFALAIVQWRSYLPWGRAAAGVWSRSAPMRTVSPTRSEWRSTRRLRRRTHASAARWSCSITLYDGSTSASHKSASHKSASHKMTQERYR